MVPQQSEVKVLKVMVRFDDVSVLVPCTDSSMTIKQLMLAAANRFKKAIGKPHEYGVNVINLKSLEGGILDEDDEVSQVIENKEKIIAVFEEDDKRIRSSRGDGRSSIETNSPDMSRKQPAKMNYPDECFDENSFMTRQTSEPVLSANDPQLMDDDPNASCSQDDTILSMRRFERSSTRRRCSSNGNNVSQPQHVSSALPPIGFVRNASWRKSTFRGSKNVMNWVQNQQQQHLKVGASASDFF
ncbi:hypothetical protein HELRODRAFT_175158 [Helobdella robusta]|uniref:Par3/HAL N-terminal domain-containing protein n=1 Tax=Helobdella robusta TaxID=6412 RepID=T1F8X7_HELRO|nr:hypothetical protein HELRODRAFT_175158 [Helobdella robusta]ESO01128.1 hypothetical protein HELRODRAFT_175158 [Helobdella robusta]